MLDRRAFIGIALGLPFISVGEAVAAITSLEQYVVLRGDGTGHAKDKGPGFHLRTGPYDDPAAGFRYR